MPDGKTQGLAHRNEVQQKTVNMNEHLREDNQRKQERYQRPRNVMADLSYGQRLIKE